ncbi:hypothetical protein QJQ45_025324, partial [Haematococcus lacustris]
VPRVAHKSRLAALGPPSHSAGPGLAAALTPAASNTSQAMWDTPQPSPYTGSQATRPDQQHRDDPPGLQPVAQSQQLLPAMPTQQPTHSQPKTTARDRGGPARMKCRPRLAHSLQRADDLSTRGLVKREALSMSTTMSIRQQLRAELRVLAPDYPYTPDLSRHPHSTFSPSRPPPTPRGMQALQAVHDASVAAREATRPMNLSPRGLGGLDPGNESIAAISQGSAGGLESPHVPVTSRITPYGPGTGPLASLSGRRRSSAVLFAGAVAHATASYTAKPLYQPPHDHDLADGAVAGCAITAAMSQIRSADTSPENRHGKHPLSHAHSAAVAAIAAAVRPLSPGASPVATGVAPPLHIISPAMRLVPPRSRSAGHAASIGSLAAAQQRTQYVASNLGLIPVNILQQDEQRQEQRQQQQQQQQQERASQGPLLDQAAQGPLPAPTRAHPSARQRECWTR